MAILVDFWFIYQNELCQYAKKAIVYYGLKSRFLFQSILRNICYLLKGFLENML